MKKLGLFGGSFDPIHRGHVEPVLAAADALRLEQVLYLPTARPPHKSDRDIAPALARYAMVELALLDHDRLRASDVEMTPGSTAYTIDTVAHFKAARPEVEWHYIVGSDAFVDLPHWRRGAELLESVDFVVLSRPGFTLGDLIAGSAPDDKDLLQRARVQSVETGRVDISSTRLRRALTHEVDHELATMLDPRVLRYIRKYGLYRASDD